MQPDFLQCYWWAVISLLGGLLVFMMFVQGGQSLMFCSAGRDARALMVASLGRKWELTFTTLVVFGGAFFAAFPLYYSTCFGGAYWLWMLILLSFVVQAVSYEFRSRRGNIYTFRTYDAFLVFNGVVGTVLIGVAVGMMFFGADFSVSRAGLLDAGSPVISRWGPAHGLEAILNWKCLLLGVTVFFLTRTLGALYFVNNINDRNAFGMNPRIKVLTNGTLFALLLVCFLLVLFHTTALRLTPDGGYVPEKHVYWHDLLRMWWIIPVLVAGAGSVLFGIYRSAFSSTYRYGIWWAGTGTVVTVMALFWLAGFGNTPFLPSYSSPSSSLTIVNASATHYTLEVMAWASLVIPFVAAYITLTWYKMNLKPLTAKDLKR